MTPIEEIAAERQRQKDKEGWTLDHDDEHNDRSLAAAAAAYCYYASLDDAARRANKGMDCRAGFICILDSLWPGRWATRWWKPKSRRRDLVRAGALIVAELERLDRAKHAPTEEAA